MVVERYESPIKALAHPLQRHNNFLLFRHLNHLCSMDVSPLKLQSSISQCLKGIYRFFICIRIDYFMLLLSAFGYET